jgi:hypothetical protein
MTRRGPLAADGPLLRFRSAEGAPVHVNPRALFAAKLQQPGVVYEVPDSCAFRLASSPLQKITVVGDEVVSEPQPRVDGKYLSRATFRKVTQAVRVWDRG